MNKSYRSVWNEALGTWVAASETVSARGRKSRSGSVAAAVLALVAVAGSQGAQAQAYNGNATPGSTAISDTAANCTSVGLCVASALAVGSVAVGCGASANTTVTDATALGVNAVVTVVGGVALGESSRATVAATPSKGITFFVSQKYDYAGATPISVVSIGGVAGPRQLQNVAAGQVSPNSTDGINGSQLSAAHQAIELTHTGVANLASTVNNIAGDTNATNTDVNGIGIR
ncbi:ESPR domain-containing protein [Variovorax paradoxus]|nr:ESPR domain-containing protein [Variovorax paradoxus]